MQAVTQKISDLLGELAEYAVSYGDDHPITEMYRRQAIEAGATKSQIAYRIATVRKNLEG